MCILAVDVLLRMHLAVHDELSSNCSVETAQLVMELITAQSNCVAVLHQNHCKHSGKVECCPTKTKYNFCMTYLPTTTKHIRHILSCLLGSAGLHSIRNLVEDVACEG